VIVEWRISRACPKDAIHLKFVSEPAMNSDAETWLTPALKEAMPSYFGAGSAAILRRFGHRRMFCYTRLPMSRNPAGK
jgi:hypothetical protein